MKERPIVFTGPMVRAILEGRKTQERRVVKPQPQPNGGAGLHPVRPYNTTTGAWNWVLAKTGMGGDPFNCPFGVPGDRLWVRETFVPSYFDDGRPGYRADWSATASDLVPEPRWTPSILMPRRFSRLTLEVVNVRVERLQEISEADAIAEGIRLVTKDGTVNKFCVYDLGDYSSTPWSEMSRDAVSAYRSLWDSINAKRGHSWASNPWVWVIEFKRLEGGQ